MNIALTITILTGILDDLIKNLLSEKKDNRKKAWLSGTLRSSDYRFDSCRLTGIES